MKKFTVSNQLRLLFLMPLAAAIFSIVFILVIALYYREHKEINKDIIHLQVSLKSFYRESVRHDTNALLAIMGALRGDHQLALGFDHQNRARLLKYTLPLYKRLNKNFNITHFYFIRPNRTILLRAHAPSRIDDKINRLTAITAEETGKISHGVELGPLGTFTLRVVEPWYKAHTKHLMGYLELGMEIDRVLEQFHDFFGVNVYVFIDKNHLKKKGWENGMRLLGRTPNWDQFPDAVLNYQSSPLPAFIEKSLKHSALIDVNETHRLNGKLDYRAISMPIKDMRGTTVAKILIIANVSDVVDAAHQTVLIGAVSLLAVGLILLLLFYLITGKIGHRIELKEEQLKHLANHDGLTGLYNHRTFHKLLKNEISRSARYHTPLSLLMIDIDHFKEVNDEYGHQSGDLILQELSKLLIKQVRENDRVCRYGGEEMTIIMPEANQQQAISTATRLLKAVEVFSFHATNNQSVSMTISIGISSFSESTNSSKRLIAAADKALYEAKEKGRNCFIVI